MLAGFNRVPLLRRSSVEKRRGFTASAKQWHTSGATPILSHYACESGLNRSRPLANWRNDENHEEIAIANPIQDHADPSPRGRSAGRRRDQRCFCTRAGVTAYVAPSIKPEEVLKGEIKSCPFSQSAIFPGTVRDVSVFIPAQYDGSKPACVYVKTDGYNPREKALLETLIATKEMPVTIGVFVRPGDLPATDEGHDGTPQSLL